MSGQRKFVVLDGLRGIAALCVVVWHASRAFEMGVGPASGYLAVDVFFCISGFVLAHAYGASLERGMSTMKFLKIRLARLYPLYALGTFIAVVGLCGQMAFGLGRWSGSALFVAVTFAAVMLPFPANHSDGLYPLNNPAWSLGFELFVNAVFAATWKFLNNAVLTATVIFSAGWLISSCLFNGSLNVGHSWATLVPGIPRVLFGFFCGVLLYRVKRARHFPVYVSNFCLIALGVVLWCGSTKHREVYDLCCILLVGPSLVFFAAHSEPGKSLEGLFRFTGSISYAVYVVHVPVLAIVSHIAGPRGGLATEVVLIAALVVLAWLLDTKLDGPFRRRLSAILAG